MTVMNIPVSFLDHEDSMVCVFCDTMTDLDYCISCNEYKGLMTVSEWESYTGETWESQPTPLH